MEESEFEQFVDLDRSERVRTAFKIQDGDLTSYAVDWDIPSFFAAGDGAHSVAEQVGFCRSHLERGGRMIGAFDGETLVGVGVLTPEVRPEMAQLAFLHVSAGYRREGIATRILQTLIEAAFETGARQMVVSATPSESAIGFYLAQGFLPADVPLPELYELEPDDIHMLRDI
jgi:GNAT superfamily N-acetyltransferase